MNEAELSKRMQEDSDFWRMAYSYGFAAGHEPVINRLSWHRAVALAIEVNQTYGIKQVVFKDPRRGWTYRSCE